MNKLSLRNCNVVKIMHKGCKVEIRIFSRVVVDKLAYFTRSLSYDI